MKTGLQKAAEILLPDVPNRLKVKEIIERLLVDEQKNNHPLLTFDFETGAVSAVANVPATKVLYEVQEERDKQDKKWGQQDSRIREELLHTAAVAVAMIEAFDRQQGTK